VVVGENNLNVAALCGREEDEVHAIRRHGRDKTQQHLPMKPMTRNDISAASSACLVMVSYIQVALAARLFRMSS
jgi:hypothetical protein